MIERTKAKATSNGGNFVVYFICSRWLSLFASFWVMAGAGATYLFGVYSKDIKSSLGYDQTTLNLLGFFKDLGANVGVLSGLLAEVTPTWFVLLVGAGLNFFGYFMIWLGVTGRIARPKVWQMCIYICCGANSQNFVNTGALVTSVKNFPENRGIMIGLLKGFTGLSGAIMMQLYLAVYGNDSKDLILLIAWLPAALSVVFLCTIRTMKGPRQSSGLRPFYHILYGAIVLALFLLVLNIIEKVLNFPRGAYTASAVVSCGLCFVPLFVSIREEFALWKERKNVKDAPKITIEDPSFVSWKTKSQSEVEKKQETSCFANIFNKPERGEDYSILQAILSIDMLILFVTTFCGVGSSLTAVDNLGQVGESLGYPTKTVKTFVSLVSIWNFFGRIVAGFGSEALLAKYKFPRPLIMTINLLLSCIGLLLVAFPFRESVYIASVIIGISFGAQLPLLYTIISELFGLKHYSTLFNAGQIACPLGSYILNVKVTGPLYDREAKLDLAKKGLEHVAGQELTCIGGHCYRLSFIILASITLFGALACLLLVVRTREFYRSDIYEKFKVNEEQAETELAVKKTKDVWDEAETEKT